MNDILNMQAGRELDAEVAKLMGWTDFSPIDPECEFSVGVNGHRRNYAVDPSDGKSKAFPLFSSNIAAAWEILEKFHEVSVKRFETMKGHRYYCRIELTYDGDPIIAQGATAPEAISKAALLALEGNRGD